MPRKRVVGAPAKPGDETEVYCGGGVDLFAFNDTERHRLGSEEALEALDDKIRLQSWLNQVEQVEELFMPLVEPLKRMHRATSVMPDLDAGTFHDISAIGAGRQVTPTVRGATAAMWDSANAERRAAEAARKPERLLALPPPPPASDADADTTAPTVEDDAHVEDLETKSHSTHSHSTHRTRKHSKHFEVHEAPIDAGRNLAWREDGVENAHARGPVVVPLATNLSLSKKVRRRKRERNVVSRIPWSLLDELDAEKQRFEAQKVADTLIGGGS